MRWSIALSVFVIALLVGGGPARAEEKATPANAQRLEALKGLAGDWVEVGKDGKPTEKVVSSIRVTAAGSAVQETLFPGSEHEMVTMYHLDGKDLVLTSTVGDAKLAAWKPRGIRGSTRRQFRPPFWHPLQ